MCHWYSMKGCPALKIFGSIRAFGMHSLTVEAQPQFVFTFTTRIVLADFLLRQQVCNHAKIQSTQPVYMHEVFHTALNGLKSWTCRLVIPATKLLDHSYPRPKDPALPNQT